MAKINKPSGLIRYSSQLALETGKPTSKLRPRVVIYTIALAGLVAGLVLTGSSRPSAEVTILRGLGAPFSVSGNEVVNQLRLKVRNRGEKPRTFSVTLTDMPEAKLVAPELPLLVAPSEQGAASFFVLAPRSALHGSRHVHLRVGDANASDVVSYTLLGPENQTESAP
jgi:polyferredoxin